MAEIPRKPTFPDHVVQKLLSRIQQQVDNEVIPVSTGIYTEQKLVNTIQAIPKPVLVDYQDRIFYQAVQKQGTCPLQACPTCNSDFSNKRKPIMCHFCSHWQCDQCICHRKRLHPLDKNPNGTRYSICYDCDGKYLSLQLNHAYVENRMLVETAIIEVSKEIEQLDEKIDNQKRKVEGVKGEPKRKINMKISILKKQELDLRKSIKKVSWEVENARDSRGKLQQKLIEARTKQANQPRRIRTQEAKETSNQVNETNNNWEQLRQDEIKDTVAQELYSLPKILVNRIEQQPPEILQEIEPTKQQQDEEQKQRRIKQQQQRQAQRLQKQAKQQLKRQKQAQKQRRIQKQKQQLEKQKQLDRLRQIQRQKQQQQRLKLEEERKLEQQRQAQMQRQRQIERLKQQERKKQELIRKQQERLKELQRIQQEKRKKQQQWKIRQAEYLKQKQQQRLKQQAELRRKQQEQQQQMFSFNPTKLQSRDNDNFDGQFSPNETSHTDMASSRNSQMYNQFKNYFTESEFTNPDPDVLANEPQSREEMLKKLKKSLEEDEKQASKEAEQKKMEILKQAARKQKQWQRMAEEELEVLPTTEKCKCTVF